MTVGVGRFSLVFAVTISRIFVAFLSCHDVTLAGAPIS
jgi:hypothetical protein